NTYGGGTTVNAGTLAGDTTSLQGDITNNAQVEFNQTGAGTYAGIMSGSGSLTKTGTGTLTLSGTNTYSGGTTVSAGTLAGNIAANTNLTVAGGAAYDGTGAARTVNALNGSGNIINGNGLTAQSGAFSGVISGTGGIEKTGTGTLTLSGTNTFTGPLSIDTGGLTLGTGGSLAAQRLSLGAGTIFDYSSATAYASTSPAALKNLTVNGVGASIIPAAGGADFTNATILFNIPQSALASDVLLSINGDAAIDANTQVALAYPAGRPDLNQGEYLKLLDVSGTLNPNGVTQLTVQTIGGDTFTIEVDPMNPGVLQAIISTISPTGPAYERLKAYAENRAVSLAFANQGLDFILNRGFGSALAATSGQGSRFGSFGGLGGGWSRYNTGSHVDVSGMSLLAGLAFGNDIARGRLTFGAFFEGGWGNYDSHNSFSNAASVGGKGDTSYHGGGVLGRYELTQGALSGLYFDASARMGRAETDFRSGDIQYNGWKADFESSALYYGLHGGLGYVWMIPGLDGKGSLDLSAKLLWTRQEGDSLTVYQDRLRFKDADSLRTRLGGRFAYSVNEYVSPYLGAYWEHEFDGKLRASVNGQSLSSPSLRGDTGMGELGLSLKPSQSLPLSFDLGVQGYMGKREGVTGSLQIKFEF
ncbi:MAG: autotransporter-associated beta strand repeat-containing protein, partial [Deltaproteobacteria bacterium]|nr:autotransporter-associated beta strand repeat-containing protein [Deltaproteobacteria bacterium]